MFQHFYNEFMSDIDYESLYEFMKPYLKPTDLILDAGCGSGYMMLELAQKGYTVIGIDLDSTMLALAQDKLNSMGYQARLYEHDLRKTIHAKVDVVYVVFDVLNYM